MPEPAHKKKATYEDILQLPSHQLGEILDGDLVVSPRPSPRHAHASLQIGGDLGPSFGRPGGRGRGGPGGWWILFEPEVHLRSDILVPDIVGWRRERLPALPEEAAFSMAPDWVCEVISPSTAASDRVQKLRIYAREGVAHVWLVDPLATTLEIYRLEDERWVLVSSHAGDATVRAEPFDDIELALRDWWPLEG